MKRFLSCVLALILVFTSLCSTAIFAKAAGTPTISFSSVETENGETVSLELSMKNNPGIAGLAISLKYDTNSLTLIETKKGNLFSGFTAAKNFAWDESEDVTADGVLATFSFAVSETAASGDYDVEIIVRSCTNANLDDVTCDVQNGKVTVKGTPVSATGVTLNKHTLSLGTGTSETLIATVSPDNATNKNITWKSSDNSVATVDSNGKVTALTEGTATITVTTEDGEFTANCAVRVDCSHKNTTVHSAKASTCQEQGNSEYTTCDDCGAVISGSDAKLPLVDHSYTEKAGANYLKSAATCGSKAVYYKSCSVCGEKGTETFETGEYNYTNHIGETYKKNQKEATCFEEGYTGDIYCSTCDREISKGSTIPKGTHNPASVWSTDETNHWKVCQTVGCGNIIDKAPHSGGEATCKNQAVCSVCGVKYGELDAFNHSGTTYLKDQKEATCYEEGYTGDTYCSDCNVKIKDGTVIEKFAHNPASVWSTDETNHWKVCQTVGCGNIIDKAPHSGGEATCVTKAVCSVCGVQYGEVNISNHKHTEVRDAKAATEQEKGYTGDTWCLDCDKKIAEGKDIEKLEHKPVLVKAKEPTAAKEGNIEHYYCENCGKYYMDETGTKEISKEDTTIVKLAPKIIDGNNVKIDKSSKAPVSFRSDAAFADFIRVELDGKELVRDKDYTVKEGSIIVTLTPEFTATLTAGEHTLGIVSTSGTAVANFTVTAGSVPNDSANNNSERSPQTGDYSNIFLWGFITIISLVVLCATCLLSKKRK